MHGAAERILGTLAVIMPVWGHAGLLGEAIESVRRSRPPGLAVQVIVSVDGDPQCEILDILVSQAANDDALHVLFAENGGPGAARNRAIDYAIEHFPTLRAVYFLDADNRLLPATLAKLWQHKCATDADWVYTNIDAFSVRWTAHYGARYSRLAHCIADNICDTGSLVDVEVFRRGIRFDESRDNGFEDWDFWLSCVEAGFTGSHCPGAAFEYRLRAESRFKDANRHRAAAVRTLHQRHPGLYRRDRLVGFEHADAPRYALLLAGTGLVQFLTDPRAEPQELAVADAVQRYWAARAEPDVYHFPPFLLCTTAGALEMLQESRLLPGILSRLERLVEDCNVAYLDLMHDREQIAIAAEQQGSGLLRSRPSDLVAVRTELLDDVVDRNALEWFRSVAAPQVWPTAATMTVRFPLARTRRGARLASAEQGLVSFAECLGGSLFRPGETRRWTWRQALVCEGRNLHRELRRQVDGAPVLPLGPQPEGRRTAAVLVPIAAYGGAEKVAYAAARALHDAGYETHLFVLGSGTMAILDTFDPYFDFLHIWADGLPRWGGDRRFIGHDFIDDDPGVDWKLLKGQLSGFDLVVNNHVMAAHPIMGRLRAEGTRTACYLHVADYTPMGRPAGQPFAALAFEHAYDAFLTCSDALKRHLMSFGVAGGKIFAVANGPGFSLAPAVLAGLRADRGQPRPGPLRLLYIGRFDVQKGIDRLHAVLQRLAEIGVPFIARAVGSELLKDGTEDWAPRLSRYAEVLPPAFRAEDLAAHLHWADATLLPSRWEGAPLVVREAQYLGSIPIATNVGAVAEQITSGTDGLLVDGVGDEAIVAAFVGHIQALADPAWRRSLTGGAIAAADAVDWRRSFAHFTENII